MASPFIYEPSFLAPPSISRVESVDSTPLLGRDTDSPPPLFAKRVARRISPLSHLKNTSNAGLRLEGLAVNDRRQPSWNEEDFSPDLDRQLNMNVLIKFSENGFGLNHQPIPECYEKTTKNRNQDKPRQPKYSCFPVASYDTRDTLIDSYLDRLAVSSPSDRHSSKQGTRGRVSRTALTSHHRNYAYPNLPALSRRVESEQPILTRPITPSHPSNPFYSSQASTLSNSSTSSSYRTKTQSPSPSSTLTMSSSSSFTLVTSASAPSSRRLTPELLPHRKISYRDEYISPPTPSIHYPLLDPNDPRNSFLDIRGLPPTPPIEPARLRDDIQEDDAYFSATLLSKAVEQAPSSAKLRRPSRPALQPAPPPSHIGTPVPSPGLSTAGTSTPTEPLLDEPTDFWNLDDDDELSAHRIKKIKSLARIRAPSRNQVPTQSTFDRISTTHSHDNRYQPQSRALAFAVSPQPGLPKSASKSQRQGSVASHAPPTNANEKRFRGVWRVLCCGSRNEAR